MELRVVNWNVGKVSRLLAERLKWIVDLARPDLILTQEGHSPFLHLLDRGDGAWKEVWWTAKRLPQVKREGSAIFAPRLELEPIRVGRAEGWITAAATELPVGLTAVVSVHAPTNDRDHKAFGLTRNTCGNWMLEVAMPEIEAAVAGYPNVILGGDTNCSRYITGRMGKPIYAAAHKAISSKYGYVEALWHSNGQQEVPTYRWRTDPDFAIPNDHLFVRGPISELLVSSDALVDPSLPGDHRPVLSVFRLDAAFAVPRGSITSVGAKVEPGESGEPATGQGVQIGKEGHPMPPESPGRRESRDVIGFVHSPPEPGVIVSSKYSRPVGVALWRRCDPEFDYIRGKAAEVAGLADASSDFGGFWRADWRKRGPGYSVWVEAEEKARDGIDRAFRRVAEAPRGADFSADMRRACRYVLQGGWKRLGPLPRSW